jgi:3-phenylpropionate/trans-cinnamate dioxygenase ferredoxin reductase subunit
MAGTLRAQYDIVIVGAGKAGVQTASSLRDEGFAGEILLVGDEASAPYDRPPLSKSFLTGQGSLDDITLHGEGFYESRRIALRTGTGAVGLDRGAGNLVLGNGEAIGYGRLVLATGARARLLPLFGREFGRVVSLRTAADAIVLRKTLPASGRVVVIGGGFIGLEVAAVAARTYGSEVVVVEALPRLMSRSALPASASGALRNLEFLGVRVLTGTAIAAVHSSDHRDADGVTTADGDFIPADLIVSGVGAIPNTELAEDAGLPVANGVLVDETLRTADPRVWAIGDCAAFPGAGFPSAGFPSDGGGGRVRPESLQNATDQGRHVARALATGAAEPYRALPWFWSDQGDLRFQSVGLTAGHDRTAVLGDPASGSFSVLAFREGRLLGGDSVNAASDHRALRRLLAAERGRWEAAVTPEACAAPGFALGDLARGLAEPRAAVPRSV